MSEPDASIANPAGTLTLDLRLGDCKVRLKDIATGSVVAIVCDPPYELNFMNRGWDLSGIAHDPLFWSECLRVLVPGGTVKAFAATRTYHRMTESMEKAGFEVGSFEAWAYGCLSEDSEILTETGWKLGTSVTVGEQVACWDHLTGEIRLDVVQEVTNEPFSGEMVCFKNDNTDQLLTPNHRVYKKHRIRRMAGGVRVKTEESDWNVQSASSINRWNNIRLPLAGRQDGPGIGGCDMAELLGWVWSEGEFDATGVAVRITQSSVNQEYVDAIESIVQKMVPKYSHYTREREHTSRDPLRGTYKYVENTWYFSGEMAAKIQTFLPNKHPTWDLIWRMTQNEKKAFMWASVRGDGSVKAGKKLVAGGTGVEHYCFYQKCTDDLEKFQTLCHLTNRQGRVNLNKQVVGVHDNPQTELQGRHLRATNTAIYTGQVWCVRVPTGAFVARRNGKVFITGNSGFPKSLNVSKKLGNMEIKRREQMLTDALQAAGFPNVSWSASDTGTSSQVPITVDGNTMEVSRLQNGKFIKPDWLTSVEPTVVGTKNGVGGQNMNDIVNNKDTIRTTDDIGGKGVGAYGTGAKQVAIDIPVTVPSTEDAKTWEGWGTALKPAWEPIVIGRKPFV